MKFLTKDQKSFYSENGYIKLENILTNDEINHMSKEYDDIFQRQIDQKSNVKAIWKGDWQTKFEANNQHVNSIHNLQLHSGVFTEVLLNERLLDAIEDIMESGNIVLHHTKAHLKPPEQGAPFPMHQDYHYFPYKDHSMLAIFIHLDDTSPENGGLAIFPGSHKNGPLQDASNHAGFHYVNQDIFKLEDAKPVTAKKGDIVIFSYLLVHGSFQNISTKTRKMFLIQLASADDIPISNMHKSPCAGMVLRGKNNHITANLNERHESASKNDPKF